jgi:hypothetical protein
MNCQTIRREYPLNFILEIPYMGNVLQHVGAENDVKRVVVERKYLSIIFGDFPDPFEAVVAGRKVDRANGISTAM